MKRDYLRSTRQAFQSFLFVPALTTRKGSHIRDCNDLKRVMIAVVLALVPCLLFGMYNTGLQHFISMGIEVGFWQTFWYGFIKVLPLLIVSYIVGLGIEFGVAQVRDHEVNEGYLVTGMLIPLIIPVTTPLWMLAIAVAFAVIFGKEIFGGTGMNIWNPALLCRAFLFFAYPAHMTGDEVWVDGVSGATTLSSLSQNASVSSVASISDLFWGFTPGCIGETSVFCILLGAALLIYTGVASWKTMISCLAGAIATSLLCNLFATAGSYAAVPFYYHILSGGFAFGCVFMITDPVTSPQTETGKWIFGFGVGIFVIVLRLFNPGFPEGMMLAILLMNTFAPLIDHCVVSAHCRRRLKKIGRYER